MTRWSNILPQEILQIGDQLTLRAVQERQAGKKIYPEQGDIFKALNLTTPDKLKVCIIGQDPYHTPGQANGLAFSITKGHPLQPSLQNIFKELTDDLHVPYPESGDLTAWAERGVLLLNTSLTVYQGQPNSCADWGWETFTHAVFQKAMELPQPIVFILWGAKAINFISDLDINAYPNKRIITSSHPSPFSAHKTTSKSQAFFGSRPFSTANVMLMQMGSDPIDWSLSHEKIEQKPWEENQKLYRELMQKYRISTNPNWNPETQKHEPINPNKYDIIVQNIGSNGLSTAYKIVKNTPKLTEKELAIICDSGNLCYGYHAKNDTIFIHID